MEESSVKKSVKGLEGLTKGALNLDALVFAGLEIIDVAREGFVRCKFVVPPMLAADKIGNWQVGAMVTLMDIMGGAAICSLVGHIPATADLSISFYSTAKIQEEVEIEARIVGSRGRLTSVVVEVRRKENRQLIALGKQWLTSTDNSRQLSKL